MSRPDIGNDRFRQAAVMLRRDHENNESAPIKRGRADDQLAARVGVENSPLDAAAFGLRTAGRALEGIERGLANWCLQLCREWIARYFRLKVYYLCNWFATKTAMMIYAGP
jgi:hypothetical protein